MVYLMMYEIFTIIATSSECVYFRNSLMYKKCDYDYEDYLYHHFIEIVSQALRIIVGLNYLLQDHSLYQRYFLSWNVKA